MRRDCLAALVATAVAALTSCGNDSTAIAGASKPAGKSCASITPVSAVPGQVQLLPPGESPCITLPAGSGTYSLAFYDMRSTVATRAGTALPTAGFSLTLTDLATAAASAADRVTAGLRPGARPSDVLLVSRATQPRVLASRSAQGECIHTIIDFTCQATPWRVGDHFSLRADSGKVYGLSVFSVVGPMVLAIADVGAETYGADARDSWTRAAQRLVSDALPVYRAELTATTPVSSDGAGQFLVMFNVPLVNIIGGAFPFALAPGRSGGSIVLGMGHAPHEQTAYYFLAHETAHLFQGQVTMEQGNRTPLSFSPRWAVEGGADLAAYDALRRAAGVPLDANLDMETAALSADPWLAEYATWAYSGVGDLEMGYASGESFLRDQVQRARKRGVPTETARRSIARASLNGGFGYMSGIESRPGMQADMKTLLGTDWDPATAILTWTISASVDDRGGAPGLANDDVLNVWHNWGANVPCFSVGDLTKCDDKQQVLSFATGKRVVIDIPLAGYSGYLGLAQRATPFTLRLDSNVPGMTWAITRR